MAKLQTSNESGSTTVGLINLALMDLAISSAWESFICHVVVSSGMVVACFQVQQEIFRPKPGIVLALYGVPFQTSSISPIAVYV